MLDEDLAELYGVETRVLVQQVRRNEKRFPADFMSQLSTEGFSNLKSQSVISSGGHGGRRKRPLVLAEQGVAMLSGVLRSDRAVAVNIEIMRAFVELRRVAGSFDELQKRLDQMELDIGARLSEHDEFQHLGGAAGDADTSSGGFTIIRSNGHLPDRQRPRLVVIADRSVLGDEIEAVLDRRCVDQPIGRIAGEGGRQANGGIRDCWGHAERTHL